MLLLASEAITTREETTQQKLFDAIMKHTIKAEIGEESGEKFWPLLLNHEETKEEKALFFVNLSKGYCFRTPFDLNEMEKKRQYDSLENGKETISIKRKGLCGNSTTRIILYNTENVLEKNSKLVKINGLLRSKS